MNVYLKGMIMLRKTSLTLTFFVLAGCAGTLHEMQRTYWQGGSRWGCDAEQLRADNARAHQGTSAVFMYQPEPGWEACYMLARTGLPDRLTTVADRQGGVPQQHLYFDETPSRGGGLVVLVPDGDRWVVDEVVWNER